jgi:hypothetical protein
VRVCLWWACLVLLVATAGGCARQSATYAAGQEGPSAPPATRAEFAVTEIPVGAGALRDVEADLPDGGPPSFLAPRGRHLIVPNWVDGEHGAIVDGKPLSTYGGLGYVWFTPDGEHWWYTGSTDEQGAKLVVDGRPTRGPHCGYVYDAEVQVSDDARHVAYLGAKTGHEGACAGNAILPDKCFVAVDGERGLTYGYITGLTMTPDGSRLAYRAGPKADQYGDGGPWCIVLDGTEGPRFSAVSDPHFSPDGRRVAYVASPNGQSTGGALTPASVCQGKCMLIVDGVAGPRYDRISEWCFSPDSKHVACIAGEGKWHGPESFTPKAETVVLDGLPGPSYPAIERLRFSADSQHVAYVVCDQPWFSPAMCPTTRSPKEAVVLDGERGPWHEYIDGPVFRPIGSGYAYLAYDREGDPATKSATSVAVIDGQPGRRYGCVESLCFSADGTHAAYVAREATRDRWTYLLSEEDKEAQVRGPAWLVVDGVESREYDDIGQPVFAPTGYRLACWVKRNGQWRVWLDGKEGTPYDGSADSEYAYRAANLDEPALYFSHDGKHLAYWARQRDAWYMVLDGREGARFDRYYDNFGYLPVLFTPSGDHLAYVGIRTDKWVLVLDGEEVAPYDCVYSRSVGLGDTCTLRCAARRGDTYYYVECHPTERKPAP